MPSINAKLFEKIVTFQIQLKRLDAGTRKRVVTVLEKLQKDLISEVSGQEITGLSKASINAKLKDISTILVDYYSQAEDILDQDLKGLAKAQTKQAVKSLQETVFINTDVNIPTETLIDRVVKNTLITGGPISSWWQRQTDDLKFKLGNAIRQGVLLNETNQQIIARIVGKGAEPGILPIARRNAAALVQTAVAGVANDARQLVYERNDDIIKSFVWFTALDSHVCPLCMGRSGKEWKNNKERTPIGHSIPLEIPPIHYNDRCLLLPRTLTFEEMGIELPETPVGTRASSLGQIDGNTTFDEYLKMVPQSQQDEMLGKGRAQLWRDKKITLNDLLDGQGRELTLAELEEKHL